MTANHRNVNFASLEEVGKLNDSLESLSQRAEQKSAGGPMVVYLSESS